MKNLKIGSKNFNWGERTYIMGILNVTPDSFSDGGQFNNPNLALEQGLKLADQGADIIDIGGQSTRPGAPEISLEEELARVIPVITALRPRVSIPLSVDTTRPQVAEEAILAGADLVNDVSGGTFSEAMFPTVAKLQVPLVLMHRRGTPETMQQLTDYTDLIGEINGFFRQQIQKATQAGLGRSQLLLDPGIGFAKTTPQNLELIRQIPEFRRLDLPILVGVSRKSFIGKILEQNDPQQRQWGTAAACCGAIAGFADILRVHDVAPMRDVCRVADAIWRG